ncbi:acyl-CoA dehydrogenase [Parapedobacter sp. 10938]|uniref:acyl-CoA dehydrogenase n=1 Tax=Parapedobacter flavus TaxID=3110225 RepID=UPI002DBB5D65|nr:acyl-CoA dehydrogenase [Parapedobacter sp. 10938]MEC3878849.1 acyl-CoA dehydrogenase [Parapedobacter sp. 10938]
MKRAQLKYDKQPVPAALAEQLRQWSADAETQGALTAGQLAIIYDQRWFKLFVPRNLGGLQLPLPEGVRLEEELARIDGSLGWTVTLCAGANLFVGYMDRSVGETIFSDRRVCLGGSGQATGKAVDTDGGYVVSGKWRYATGAPHLTHFTANCETKQGVQSFFFAQADVRIIEDWNAFGLKATASHSFEVDHLMVDRFQAFSIAPEAATWDDPIYRYPFLPFAEATLAANTLGMTRHFLECAATLAAPGISTLVQTAQRKVMDARTSFYDALDTSWELLLRDGELPPEVLGSVSQASRTLVKISRELVVAVYPHVGMVGADASSEMNRVWRDIFTASQHSLLRQ